MSLNKTHLTPCNRFAHSKKQFRMFHVNAKVPTDVKRNIRLRKNT